MAVVLRLAELLIAGVFLSTYFLPDGSALAAYLPALDEAGFVLLVLGSVLGLGVVLRLQFLGPIELRTANRLWKFAMAAPDEAYAKAQMEDKPFVEKAIAYCVGWLVALILTIVAFSLGVMVDLLRELMVLGVLLVPFGLLLGFGLHKYLSPEFGPLRLLLQPGASASFRAPDVPESDGGSR
ncbi:unnamed protein product [Effrenium voratum]|nr:unnamed protein product [Effrenium voratum]